MTKNKLYTQLIVFSALMLIGTMAKAQVKVGKNPTSINANAVFEMEDTTKGMLLPRLALSSSSAFTPLTAHVRGMVVYNTATALDVTPGFYYNDGVKWVRIAGSAPSTGSGNLTNDNGIIVTGGTGATLINASLRLDSTAVARFLGQSPVRDSFSSLTNQLITAGGITGQNLTAGTLLQTTGTPTGASLKSAGYQVDTTALKTFISNTAASGSLTGQNLTAGTLLQTTGTPTGASLKSAGYQVDTTALKAFVSGKTAVSVSAPFTGNGTTASPLSVTRNSLSPGQLVIVTGGTDATFAAASVGVDTSALKTFVSGRTAVSVSAPFTGNGTTASPLGVTRNSLSPGQLVIVTGGTDATFAAASVGVDTTALKAFVSGKTAVSVSAPFTGNGTTASPLSVTRNSLSPGQLVIVTGGTDATFAAASVGVDTTALKTFISNTATNGSLSGQNLTAGTLLQTTGTPTGASLKTAGYQVDTAALKTFIAGRTTNTLTNPSNTITSTVNGTVAIASAVNTVSNAFNNITRDLTTTVNGVAGTAVTIPYGPDSTTASNGLTMTGKDVRLGGALTAATTITTTGANTLALAGLQSGATTDSILVVNPTTNVVSRISAGRFKNGNLVVTTAASLTVADTVDVVIFRGTAASTITLPAAASNIGKVVRILNYAASATNVDITLSPAPVIQGGTTNFTNPTVSSQLTSYGSNAASALGNSIEVVSDGTNWYKLGN